LSIFSLKKTFLHGEVYGHACNLAADDMEASIADLIAATAKEGGEINHIVYTAADKLPMCPVSEITAERIAAAGKLRFQGPLLLAKHALKYLPKNAGSSITLTSGSVASKPYPNWSIIGGYAGALEGTTQILAVDMKPIRVNVVEPGPTDTELWNMPAAEYEKFKK
jgi:NAD(P)-dependent dehydrogenase (short-subunit alcohol dehydrogenase family)